MLPPLRMSRPSLQTGYPRRGTSGRRATNHYSLNEDYPSYTERKRPLSAPEEILVNAGSAFNTASLKLKGARDTYSFLAPP